MNISKVRIITVITITLLMLPCMFSCHTKISPNETTNETTDESSTFSDVPTATDTRKRILFSMLSGQDKEHLPSVYDFAEIEIGKTSVEELVDIVGSPAKQIFSRVTNKISCSYLTDEGYYINVEVNDFITDDDSDEIIFDDFLCYVEKISIYSFDNEGEKSEIIHYQFVEQNGKTALEVLSKREQNAHTAD